MSRIIKVRVIPRAKRDGIESFANGYKVRLTAVPVEGKANKALIEFLAKHFGLKKSQVSIVAGSKARDKIVEIAD